MPSPRTWSYAALLSAPSLVYAHTQLARRDVHEVSVDASNVVGTLKNLQGTDTPAVEITAVQLESDGHTGTNNAETEYTPSDFNDIIHDMDPAIAALYPEYGIQHVLICRSMSNLDRIVAGTLNQ